MYGTGAHHQFYSILEVCFASRGPVIQIAAPGFDSRKVLQLRLQARRKGVEFRDRCMGVSRYRPPGAQSSGQQFQQQHGKLYRPRPGS